MEEDMCACNSGFGPDEKKTSIAANKQAPVYQTELNSEHDVTDALYSEWTASQPRSAPWVLYALVSLHVHRCWTGNESMV